MRRKERAAAREKDREERRARRGQLARVVTPPAPKPKPKKRPRRNQAVLREAPEPTVEPAPEVAPEGDPAVDREVAAEPKTAVASQVEPEATESVPAAPSTDAQGAERRLLPNPRILQSGPCPECRRGEWSLDQYRTALEADSGTGCQAASAGLGRDLAELAKLVADSLQGDDVAFAGSVVEPDGNDILRLLEGDQRTKAQSLLAGAQSMPQHCQLFALVLPKGSRFVGFRYVGVDGRRRGDCLGTKSCGVGDAGWLSNPHIERHEGWTLIWAVFENRSKRREIGGEFRAYFEPVKDWLPPG